MNTKLIIIMVTGFLITSIPSYAECITNRNADINITKPDSIYTDHGDGTVTDNETGLMWQKCPLGLTGNICLTNAVQNLSWQGALAAANANTDYGYSDWRLPNKNELESLVEDACHSPAINETIFRNPIVGNQIYDNYWSSSQAGSGQTTAWTVDFDGGGVYSGTKSMKRRVRLVRNSN